MYPFVFLCGVITRSYLSSLILQLCNIIVCLFPKLSFDIRLRMIYALLGLVIFIVVNSYFLRVLWLALFGAYLSGWREKHISIRENDFYLLVNNSNLR